MDQPISAIEAGFKINQDGRFVLHFDTREKHDREGDWRMALVGPSLSLPHWRAAYESARTQGLWFVLLSAETKHITPGDDRDAVVAGEFGKMLLSAMLDAKAQVFDALPLRKDCQLEIHEFDWMYEWPKKESALGRSNLLRKLQAEELKQWPVGPLRSNRDDD